MDSLWAQLRTAQTVDQVFSMCDDALRQRFGTDTVDKAILGGTFLLIAFTLYVIWGIRKLFTQPAPMLESNKSNKSIANNKKQSSGKSGTSKASPAAAAEGLRGATAAEAAASSVPNSTVQAVRRSGRTRTQQVPPGGAAPLKGLPLLGVVACSPDGFLVLASSRDKRIVKAFPQFTELPKVAKDFKEAIELRDVPSDAIVTRVAFTSAGGVFALLDDVDAKVYLYRYNFDPDASPAAAPKLGLTFLRSVKVDATILAHRHEQCVLSDDASALYLMLQKEGTLDVIDLKTGAHIGSTKVKAGNTAAWAFAKDNKFAAAGSYMTDIRGYGVALRSGHTSGAVTLSKTFSCNTSAAATALLGSGAKVHRLAWSADASRLLVQYAGAPGLLELWATDVDLARDEVPTRLLGFADADFADCDTVTVTYYTAGSTSRRRDLIVVLIKGLDAVVYVVPRAHDPETFKDPTKAAPQLVLELHDPHDGEAIRWAGVGCRGTALVTGSESDGRNVVRLWPFVGSV